MTRHIVPNILMFLLLLLSACSGGDDGSSSTAGNKNATAQSTIVPLADDVANALCGLTGYATEGELVEIFGPPAERKADEGLVMLRWKNERWNADAMFSNGELQIAGAHARQQQKSKKNILKDHPTWVAGKTRLNEMESRLGPGVRVGVQWHRGVAVAESIRNKPGFDSSITRDRCSDRYAWNNLDMGGFASLRFANGILQGGL